MVIGRMSGWLLIALALLLASGDMVMALGPEDVPGIVASDIWTLLSGQVLQNEGGVLSGLGWLLMQWPAWAVVGPIGLTLVLACHSPNNKRRRFQ